MQDIKSKIYDELIKIMSSVKKGFMVKEEKGKSYHLYGTKKVTIDGRDYDSMYFSSVLIMKNFVSFYYMPIYANTEMKNTIPENLKKLLKGKTCFHITKYDADIFKSIQELLKKGKAYYKSQKWI